MGVPFRAFAISQVFTSWLVPLNCWTCLGIWSPSTKHGPLERPCQRFFKVWSWTLPKRNVKPLVIGLVGILKSNRHRHVLQTHKVALAKEPLACALRNLLTATHTRVSITVTISSADEQITNLEPMSSSFSYVAGSANKMASKRNGPKKQVSWRSNSWMLSRLQKEQITWLGPLAAETDCFSLTTSCPEGDNPICYWSVCPNWMYRPLVSVYCRSSLGDATLYPLASKKKKKSGA